MPLPRPAARTVFVALAAATFVPQAIWADINVSPNETLTTTLETLSTDTSPAAQTGNLSTLQDNVDALNTQIATNRRKLSGMSRSSTGYTSLQSQVTQQEATFTALHSLIARLQAGDTITDYTTTTDASTQATTATIRFSNSAPLTASIPGTTEDDTSSGFSSSSTGTEGTDLLTQTLQQLGSQLAGGQNPLGNIQGTLNNIVSGAGVPLTPQALTSAVTTALSADTTAIKCMPDGSQATGDGVAVYDIAAGKVYMPDGSVLEAHSGMGMMKDNPTYVNQRMNGPTPPNTYTLSMRESPYYGVAAIRMTPTNPGQMYGRDGMLAHTKLVRGAANGSHGCVAFADYNSFLSAFQNEQVKTLVVVPKKADAENMCRPADYNTAAPQSS